MPANKCIKKFIRTLKLLIFASLLGCCYTNIKNLLDKAKNIKDIKKNIVVNFSKQKRFTTLRSKQRPRRLAEKFAETSAGLAKPIAISIDTKKALQELIRTVYI